MRVKPLLAASLEVDGFKTVTVEKKMVYCRTPDGKIVTPTSRNRNGRRLKPFLPTRTERRIGGVRCSLALVLAMLFLCLGARNSDAAPFFVNEYKWRAR